MMNNKIISIAFLISVFTPTIFASNIDCGTVSTRTSYLKNNEYSLLLYHLGTVKPSILLTPGIHKLNTKIKFDKTADSNNPNTYTFNNDIELSELISFEIDVKKNTMYQIVATTSGNHNIKSNNTYEIIIKKEIPKNCEHNKTNTKINKHNDNKEIPANLQYRLDLVIMDLKSYLEEKNIINESITVENKKHIINTIGIVTNKNRQDKNGISILAITPYSIAAKLGLKPYDEILSINEIDLTAGNKLHNKDLSAISQFKKALINLSEDDKVKIEIIRVNKKMILLSSYKELSLPSYQLKIMMN
jgi:hypothetical protein